MTWWEEGVGARVNERGSATGEELIRAETCPVYLCHGKEESGEKCRVT